MARRVVPEGSACELTPETRVKRGELNFANLVKGKLQARKRSFANSDFTVYYLGVNSLPCWEETQTGHYKLHFVNIRRKKKSAGHGMPTDFTPEEHSQGKEPAYEMNVGLVRDLSRS